MDNKIPSYQVIRDMYNPKGGPVKWVAREYYKQHYATPEELKQMRREEIDEMIFSMAILIAIILLTIAAMF